MDGSSWVEPFVLMTTGAVLMPGLARIIGIPGAVAEIAYGMVLASTGAVVAAEVPWAQVMADIGFAFFLFLAGLEIDFRSIERKGLGALSLWAVIALSSFGLAAWMGSAFEWWSIWVTLAVGASSVGLLLAVIRETGIGGSPRAITMLSLAAVGELVTLVLLAGVEVMHHAHDAESAVIGFARMIGLAVTVAAVVILLRTLLWWYPAPFDRLVAKDDPTELGVRFGFGLMSVFIGLSVLAHVEPFLGAFIAGAMLASVIRNKGALEHKIGTMAYGFFVPMFFIQVGTRMSIDVAMLMAEYPRILAIMGVMLGCKLLPSALLFFQAMRWRDVGATAALLAAPLTLLIAIANLAETNQAIDKRTESVLILGGIAASLLYPSLARYLLSSGRRAEGQPTPAPPSAPAH